MAVPACHLCSAPACPSSCAMTPRASPAVPCHALHVPPAVPCPPWAYPAMPCPARPSSCAMTPRAHPAAHSAGSSCVSPPPRLQLRTRPAPPAQSAAFPACPAHYDSSFFSPSLTAAATNQLRPGADGTTNNGAAARREAAAVANGKRREAGAAARRGGVRYGRRSGAGPGGVCAAGAMVSAGTGPGAARGRSWDRRDEARGWPGGLPRRRGGVSPWAFPQTGPWRAGAAGGREAAAVSNTL